MGKKICHKVKKIEDFGGEGNRLQSFKRSHGYVYHTGSGHEKAGAFK